jgi:GMP synthase (glutamine-hydrolysing)
MRKGGFLVLDFGSQFTQLIARRLREIGVYSEILPFDTDLEKIKAAQPAGIVLSGGPSSLYEEGAPHRDVKELMAIAPLLGVCYGMQLIAQQLGGVVKSADTSEYGFNLVSWSEPICKDIKTQKVWMSHRDVVSAPPVGFSIVAASDNGAAAAIKGERAWGLQFHPEVTHTEKGIELLKAFVFDLCSAKADWKPEQMLEQMKETVLSKVPDGEKVLCAISGGVDSTVVGVLLTRILGAERVFCVFVDNGLLRKNEFEEVLALYKELGLNVKGVDAKREFLSELAGVDDPEQKRKIIGRVFMEVFEKSVQDLPEVKWLAQGTLYPDVIESVNLRGSSVTIKSHHNVGGLPEKMNLKLVEPLRELFKDEVRQVGEKLGIPHKQLWRHPFPGPGLAVRVPGAVDEASLRILQEVDDVFISELRAQNLYDEIWQAFCVLLPVRTVGVQGDARTYSRAVALRAVVSHDAMTADWFGFPEKFLRDVSNKITNQVREVNRVVLDITSKPPGTIEWE